MSRLKKLIIQLNVFVLATFFIFRSNMIISGNTVKGDNKVLSIFSIRPPHLDRIGTIFLIFTQPSLFSKLISEQNFLNISRLLICCFALTTNEKPWIIQKCPPNHLNSCFFSNKYDFRNKDSEDGQYPKEITPNIH